MRNFQHIYSAKASFLHHSLKKLENIIRQIKASLRNQTPIPIQLNKIIQQLNNTKNLIIPLLLIRHNLLTDWISNANDE